LGSRNCWLLASPVRVPPVLTALLSAPEVSVQAFLLAGHVCAVMGFWEYEPLVERFGVPMVVTGFEPLDVAHGIRMAIRQLEEGRAEVENAYPRAVTREGNHPAQEIIRTVFEECDRNWRGIGLIPLSGWRLRPEFAAYDAARRFAVDGITTQERPRCRAADVLKRVPEQI